MNEGGEEVWRHEKVKGIFPELMLNWKGEVSGMNCPHCHQQEGVGVSDPRSEKDELRAAE